MKLLFSFFRIFFLLVLFRPFHMNAQSLPAPVSEQLSQLTPKPALISPNVAAVQKYGDYSVNMYTGLPDISIPIYEVQAGELRLPITLTYHAAGFKFKDQASWVGLGWTLSTGGQISRSFQGKPDDQGNGFLTLSNDYNVPGGGDCNNWEYKERLASGNYDREPDLFNYSFPGSGGKFYLGQGEVDPYLFPYRPIKVKKYGVLNYFDITNEKGVVHRFGANWSGSSPAKEALYSQSGSSVTSGVVAWHLQEMRSPDSDDFISLTYQTVGNIQNSDFEYNLAVLDQCNTNNATQLPCPVAVGIEQQVTTSSSTTQIGVEEIIFKSGKVRFVLGANRTDLVSSEGIKRLDRVEIYRKEDGDYVLVKSYHFKTSYFRNYNNTGDSHLRLDRLEVRDGFGSLINQYKFDYHTNTIAWARPNADKARDYFGFYNGKLSNTTLIPATQIQYQPNTGTAPSTITVGSADRSTDTTYLKNAVLKRITYPTMGYTEFEFEPHRYSEGGVTTYVPGLRVKKITSFDGIRSISRDFKYGTAENGLGHKNFDLRGFYFYSQQFIRSSCATIPCDREYRSRMYFSNSVIGPGYEDAPVVYSLVTEYQNGGNSNGKTVYEFDNNSLIADPLFTVPYSNKTFRNSMSWARGKLTKKTVFNSSGTQVAQTTISYTNFGNGMINVGQGGYQWIVGRWSGFRYTPCTGHYQGNNVDGKEYSAWNFQKTTGHYLETSRTETLNFGSLTQSTTQTKGYHATYLQPTFEETTGSGNPAVVRTNYRYPFDVITNPSGSYSGLANVLKQMILKNMLTYPIEQYTWTKVTSGSNQEIVGGQVTEYEQVPSTTFYKPKRQYLLELSSPSALYAPVVLSGTSGLSKDSRHVLRLTMDSYDSRGNLLQMSFADGRKKSFLYAHDGEYLIAEGENTASTTMAYTSFETNEKGGWSYSGPESKVLPGEARSGNKVYLLNNGNITKSMSGSYKLSLWVRKNNTSSSGYLGINGVGYTTEVGNDWKLIEVSGTGGTITISGNNTVVDELRVHPAQALVNSYSVIPGIGIQAHFDPGNQGLLYRYDPFGRLETILDTDGNIRNHYDYYYIKP